MSYLRYLCLFVNSGVPHILCCVFILFFFVLCTLMLPVSLDCFYFVFLRLVYPYVASFSGLFLFYFSSSCVPLCCQFLWIVHFYFPFGII
jgi:hypothetical protein